jgi:hypothetical protein
MGGPKNTDLLFPPENFRAYYADNPDPVSGLNPSAN